MIWNVAIWLRAALVRWRIGGTVFTKFCNIIAGISFSLLLASTCCAQPHLILLDEFVDTLNRLIITMVVSLCLTGQWTLSTRWLHDASIFFIHFALDASHFIVKLRRVDRPGGVITCAAVGRWTRHSCGHVHNNRGRRVLVHLILTPSSLLQTASSLPSHMTKFLPGDVFALSQRLLASRFIDACKLSNRSSCSRLFRERISIRSASMPSPSGGVNLKSWTGPLEAQRHIRWYFALSVRARARNNETESALCVFSAFICSLSIRMRLCAASIREPLRSVVALVTGPDYSGPDLVVPLVWFRLQTGPNRSDLVGITAEPSLYASLGRALRWINLIGFRGMWRRVGTTTTGTETDASRSYTADFIKNCREIWLHLQLYIDEPKTSDFVISVLIKT